MFLPILGVLLLHYYVPLQATLPSCATVAYVRWTLGCYDTDETQLTAATFTYVNGYSPTPNPNYVNTMERYCGLQCFGLGIPYYVLYNDTTCACVNVPVLTSLILTVSQNCMAACPNTSVSGSLFCPTNTPNIGAYWFCTPISRCYESDVIQGPDVGLQHCYYYDEFDDRIEGDYVRAFCWTSTNCLQQNLLLQCVNGSWNSLGETTTAVCLPCSQSPTVCSAIYTCYPSIPPGTCVPVATTTPTVSTTMLSTTTSTTTATTSTTPTVTQPNTTTSKPTSTLATTTTTKITSTLPITTTSKLTSKLPTTTTTTSKLTTTPPATTTTKPTPSPTTTTKTTTTTSTLPTTTTTNQTSTLPATTTGISTVAQLVASSTANIVNNLPWNGGNADPLSSQQIYTLINVTNYQSSDRPTDPNEPGLLTKVSMAIIVQNIDSISELTSSFGLDMFFYLSWTDIRLDFNHLTAVGPPGSFFQLTNKREQQQLWIPPVYIGNTMATDRIDPSKHNSVLFLNSNGDAATMYRQFVTAECKMNLQDYPFDTQICPIYLGLFGFYDHQVQLNWTVPYLFNMSNPSKPFSLNEKITLPAWTVVDYYITSPELSTNTDAVCAKLRTCLLAKIVLRRKSSFYTIDTFLPNIIIMAGSCLTLWINPENVPARVSMAVTLFLTFQATSLNVRSKLPNVTYVKAIDIWLFFGQGCLFCVMAEFLILHTILNGYISIPNWRVCSMFGDNTKYVQTEGELSDQSQRGKLSRQQAAKNIEKVARVLFPTIMILFTLMYFAYYLRN